MKRSLVLVAIAVSLTFPGLVRTKASQEKASAVLSRYEDRDKGKLSRYLGEGTGELVQNDNKKNSLHPVCRSFAVNRRPLPGRR